MSVTISTTNKPLNPRAQDLSPKGYNRASLYSGKALDFDGVNDSVSVSYTEEIGGIWSWVSIIEFDSVSGYQELFGGQYGTTNATIYLKNTQLAFYTNQDNLNTAFDFETGKKYHKVIFVDGGGSRSVHCFIDKNTGEVYKSATWKSPAKGVRYDLRLIKDREYLLENADWSGSYLYAA